jgi:2-polyprenyl-6-methoxyphenol hydroxylase-like FAD-dependent oxidoreductase
MRVVINGAGIAGCAAAALLSGEGHQVTVMERRPDLFTDGAGILLYSNALVALERIGVLPQVLDGGFSMVGNTQLLDADCNKVGELHYTPVDERFPAYVGIDRNRLLSALYKKAVAGGTTFYFDSELSYFHPTHDNKVAYGSNQARGYADLGIAADGTNSHVRSLIGGPASVFSGFGLWHSLHDRLDFVHEKINASADGVKMGVIPISKSKMYLWASREEPNNPWINKRDWPAEMRSRFQQFRGWLGDLVSSIDDNTYINYTSAREVRMPPPWGSGNIVCIGDAAHATTPFMAQGGAQALMDVVSLGRHIKEVSPGNLALSLTYFAQSRYAMTNYVQERSAAFGRAYRSSAFDLSRAQQDLNQFYNSMKESP